MRLTHVALAVLCMGAVAAGQPAGRPQVAGQVGQQADALARRILADEGVGNGFCVDLGCGSGELALAILKQSDFYVHCLETDDARVAPARKLLDGSGVYGTRTGVERGDLSRLPYGDYCANLIVRGDYMDEGARGLSWKEVFRVLSPGGLAYIGGPKASADALRKELADAGVKTFEIVETGGAWAKITRQRPQGAGDWSHDSRCNPGNNPCAEDDLTKAPFQTLWIAGPKNFTKFGFPLASNGRVFLRHGGMTHEGRWKPPTEGDRIQAFNAYSGAPLWQHRLAEKWGRGFVAVGDYVFAAGGPLLTCLNASDGTVRWEVRPEAAIPEAKDWGKYSCDAGVLVATLFDKLLDIKEYRGGKRAQIGIVGLDAKDGRILWRLVPEGGVGSTAVSQGLLFHFNKARGLEAIDVATGKPRWQKQAQNAGGIRYYRGKLYTGGGVYDATNGEFIKAAQRNQYSGILVGDKVISGKFKGGVRAKDLETGKPVAAFPVPQDPYCPKTGIPAGCKFMYGRCVRSTASTHCYFITYSGTVIGDLTRNEAFPTEAFRSNCATGVIVGNGLVYNSPSGCGCAFSVRGGVSLVPVSEDIYWARPASNPTPQLEKGPAFGKAAAGRDSKEDWPAYRHDPTRNSVTEGKLSGPLKPKWSAKLPGNLTPPVVAGGKAFVGSTNHSIYALGADTGGVAWQYSTGGEIKAAPAYWNGRIYAGSQDGWVYCLLADSGELVWRYRGAPLERKMLFFGRPQSLWPIGGGVIVEDGIAYFYAGYCSHDRVFVSALDAATGRVIWCNDKAGRAVDVTGPAGGISPHGVSPSGVIAASKDILYVPAGMFAPSAFRKSDGKLLWWGRRGDSTQRSNINLQNHGGPNLALGGGLLFAGGSNPVTSTNQPFIALDAKTGRFWGADDPAIAGKAGRAPNGGSRNVERGLFGTYPIKFGNASPPVVVDGGIFIAGYRGGFKDLQKYLQTQFGPVKGNMDKWSNNAPGGNLLVTADMVVGVDGQKVAAVARSDGKRLWSGSLKSQGKAISSGAAVAGGRLYAVTDAGEVVCLSAD